MIYKLGFNKPNDGKLLDKVTFLNNIEKVKKECELFTKPNESQPMFDFNKKKIYNIKTIKQFLGFINTVFNQWGVVIKLKYICGKKTIDNKRKNIKKANYELKYINEINKFI